VSVLRYLLARQRHACSRDQLIEEFWPDTPMPTARNRLQVAVSGLRQDLRTVTPEPVIEYANGGYRINPQLSVTVDVARFDAEMAAGRAAQRTGDPAAALTAYRGAVALYRGDFAADAPFEQWTLLPRERLRLAYLDALDRMSGIQIDKGLLDDCIVTGHRMLDMDPCREDAHRLLMQCYASQGRPYLALRQYELCCRVLRATLSTRPAPETTRVYTWIRSGASQRWPAR
jgi:DNA-binding SARP family transcriptional activator